MIDASNLNPALLDGYAQWIGRLLRPGPPPTLATLDDWPLLRRRLLPRAPTETGTGPDHTHPYTPQPATVVVVELDAALLDADRRTRVVTGLRALLADIPGAALTGFPVIGVEWETAVRRHMPWMLTGTLLGVVGLLAWTFRRRDEKKNVRNRAEKTFEGTSGGASGGASGGRGRAASGVGRAGETSGGEMLPVSVVRGKTSGGGGGLLVLLPAAGAVTGLAAGWVVLGDSWNVLSLAAWPLILGLGVDDGVFVMSVFRRARTLRQFRQALEPTLHAIAMTTATTVLAFGSLITSSTPAIADLGRATALGVTGCLIVTVGGLIPLLLIRLRHAGDAA